MRTLRDGELTQPASQLFAAAVEATGAEVGALKAGVRRLRSTDSGLSGLRQVGWVAI